MPTHCYETDESQLHLIINGTWIKTHLTRQIIQFQLIGRLQNATSARYSIETSPMSIANMNIATDSDTI